MNHHMAIIPKVKHPFRIFRILEAPKDNHHTPLKKPKISKLHNHLPFWQRLTILLYQFKVKQIFKSGWDQYTDITKFSPTFRTPLIKDWRIKPPYGINPMKRGLQTNISEVIYKQIMEQIE